MVLIKMKCPHCGSEEVRKNGKDRLGKQRYICDNKECKQKTFCEKYTYNGSDKKVVSRVLMATVNGSGIRAIARTEKISKDTVQKILKTAESNIWYVNYNYIEKLENREVKIDVVSVEEAEMDEMWSFVHDKKQEIWLWWAIDHNTGEPLAFHFGDRKHLNLDELLALLEPFDIGIVYADGNFAYTNHIKDSEVITGKKNTQKIERLHLSLRTWCSRLVRKGIRFSKNVDMHILVVSIVINFWFFSHVFW